MIRNKVGGVMTNGAYASGLDVGSFSVNHDSAPDKFTVKAETSWAGTALDVTLAMLTAIFPSSKLAGKVGELADMGNCLVTASQKLATTPGNDVPAKLMEIAKSCMVTFIVDELNLGSMLGAIAKEAKIIPELLQRRRAGSKSSRAFGPTSAAGHTICSAWMAATSTGQLPRILATAGASRQKPTPRGRSTERATRPSCSSTRRT
jgi:hypothetical protein